MNKIKITFGNYTYGIRKTTKGKFYIVRSFSHQGFEKWKKGLLKNGSGVL